MSGLSHAAARELLTGLRDDVLEAHLVGWEGWAKRLSDLDAADWLLVDKLARRSTWAQPALLHGARGWESLDLQTIPVAGLAGAAMHVDGRVRESATRELSRHAGPVASAALALRLLDHVPEVVDTARAVTLGRRAGLEVDVVADVLLHGADRRVAGEQWSWLVDAWELGSPEALGVLRGSGRRLVRRWAVEQSLVAGLLEPVEVLEVAASDPDQWLRRAAAEHLTRTPVPEQLAPLLSAGSVEARLTALTRVPDDLLDDATLERLLLDRAPRVREQARWRARRRGVDVAAVARRHLDDGTPSCIAAALDGLAWVGNEADVPAVAGMLQHRSPKVRAAAVRTYAARVPTPQAVEALTPSLEDPSGRVSAAAAVVLVRAGAPAAVADQAWASSLATVRRAAWRVTRAAGGWSRVAADLRAAADPDPNLAGFGRDGVRGWLRDGAATTWGRPAAADDAAMSEHLAASGMNTDECERVAFHAGLGFERRAFGPAADLDSPARPPTPPRGIRGWLRRRKR